MKLPKGSQNQKQEIDPLEISDPEVKCNVNLVEIKENILTRFEKISNWDKMKRVMALVLKFKMKLKQKLNSSGNVETEPRMVTDSLLIVSELDLAQRQLLKLVQNQAFCKEIEVLKKKGNIPRTSRIYGLDPYVYSDGLLRVGGRLRKGELDANIAHPVLLPKNSCMSVAIIRWCHKNVAHGGRGLTLNELRQCGFWIVSASSAIRSLIHRCVVCHKLRGKLGEQRMSDIPIERISNDPPLTHCGVDMVGPFTIKERRSELKRYGTLFTCMASGTVHIEVTHSLDADSFIQYLRRFIARRGSIRTLWSDNGTNFVGAEKELWKACFEQNSKVKDFLGSKGADWIVWKKNPPNASHFGGIWERQICSARVILNGLLNNHGKGFGY